MGEILGPAILLLCIIAMVVGGIVYMQSSQRQRRALNDAPAVLLSPGAPPDVLLANARWTYGLLQRAVRILDGLNAQRTIEDPKKVAEIEAIITEFYKHSQD